MAVKKSTSFGANHVKVSKSMDWIFRKPFNFFKHIFILHTAKPKKPKTSTTTEITTTSTSTTITQEVTLATESDNFTMPSTEKEIEKTQPSSKITTEVTGI